MLLYLRPLNQCMSPNVMCQIIFPSKFGSMGAQPSWIQKHCCLRDTFVSLNKACLLRICSHVKPDFVYMCFANASFVHSCMSRGLCPVSNIK